MLQARLARDRFRLGTNTTKRNRRPRPRRTKFGSSDICGWSFRPLRLAGSVRAKGTHFHTPCCIIRAIDPVSTDISTSPSTGELAALPRRTGLYTALWVAALANVLIPAVFFSVTQFFGPSDPRYRALVVVVVLAEYAITFFLLLVHANVGFASGYSVATSATVTLGSAVLTFITLFPARWSASAIFAEVLVVAGFSFAVLSNLVFLLASIRYARAIHPRLHLGGFFLGIAAFLALIAVYIHEVAGRP